MDTHKYKQVERQYNLHLQAYLNQAAKATKTVGKKERSIYPTFKDFYDYDAAIQEIEGVSEEMDIDNMKVQMLQINTKMNEVGGE